MNNYCTLYLIRHGESQANVAGILGGQKEPNKLTETGKKQAEQTAEILANAPFSAIFSSDLSRAFETGKIIAAKHNLPVKTYKEFRERSWGVLEGRKNTALVLEDTMFNKLTQLPQEERVHLRLADAMETEQEFLDRFFPQLKKLVADYQGKTIALVAHGNLIRVLLVHIRYVIYKGLAPGAIDNAGYIVLQSDGLDFTVVETVGLRKSKP